MNSEIFFTRRSVRRYREERVEKEKIDYILKAAMYAPSAHNKRNWEFIVVEKRESLLEVVEIHKYSKMLRTAPLAIIVCANFEVGDGINEFFWQQNASAAIQNILLAAKNVGLGSVWLGVAPFEDTMRNVSKIFNIPEHVKPVGIVAIGYADVDENIEVEIPHRFEAEKIHYESF